MQADLYEDTRDLLDASYEEEYDEPDPYNPAGGFHLEEEYPW